VPILILRMIPSENRFRFSEACTEVFNPSA
jgi:hypothetical protein